MASDHKTALDQLCRLCACLPKRQFSKLDKADDLKKFFDIDALKEDSGIYPSSLCLNCFGKVSKLEKGKSSNLSPVYWHNQSDTCETCDRIQQLKKDGRKAKSKIHYDRSKSLHNMTLADVMSLDSKRPIPQAVKNAVGHIVCIETKKSSDPNKIIAFPVNNGQKVHMLEDHVIPFLEKWSAGCGFCGEQGGESIDQVFKKIKHQYAHIKNGVHRLKYTMEEHLRNVAPIGAGLIPKKRQRSKT